jgi:hypothetical protein
MLGYWSYVTNKKTFFFWGAGSSSTHVAGLNPAGLAGSLPWASDPAGLTKACVSFLKRALPGYC